MTKSKKTNRYHRLFSQIPLKQHWDWRAIGVCFVIACTFWIFNSLNTSYTTSLQYPISLKYDQKRLYLLKPPPSHLKLSVTGYGWNLLRKSLSIGVEIIEIPITNYRQQYLTSQGIIPVFSDQVKDLRINYLIEDSISFKLDTLIEQYIPIRVNERKLLFAQGFRPISNLIITPDKIKVRGPASLFDSEPESKPIRIYSPKDSIRGYFDQDVGLELPQPPMLGLEETVRLRFKVGKFEKDTAIASLKFVGFPKHSKVSAYPEVARVIYWRRLNSSPMPNFLPVVVLQYNDINPLDSMIRPRLQVSRKYIDAVCLPKQFKLVIEH